MPRARELLIPPNTSGYFHCISRCVRRAWLCGLDTLSGRSYEHRRGWVESRLLALAEVFSVSLYAYAVMSNHFHVVLKLDAEAASNWTDEEVAGRWCRLFPGSEDPEAIRRRADQIAQTPILVARYRDRLRSLSWFMRCLNEPIARQANQEDACTGRFWEGRFKAQVLLDERALLAAMVYADLNPIRARMTTQLKESTHTGIRQRILRLKGQPLLARTPLAPLAGTPQVGLSLQVKDYLALVDHTGRQWHRGKRGRIPGVVTPILKQLRLDADRWDVQVRAIGTPRLSVLGPIELIQGKVAELKQRCMVGVRLARQLAA